MKRDQCAVVPPDIAVTHGVAVLVEQREVWEGFTDGRALGEILRVWVSEIGTLVL
jgi:hypothetical protein